MKSVTRRSSILAFTIVFSLVASTLAGVQAQEDATPVPAPPVPAQGESQTIDAIKDRGTVRFGIAVAPPWLLQDLTTGEYFGPAIDVGERIGEILEVDVQYVESGWDVLIAGLQADQYDIILAPTFETEERAAVIDFATYTEAGTCYFVLRENEDINTLEDLNNPDVTIVTFIGTGTDEGIREKYPEANIRSIVQPPGGQPPIEEVLAGRADVGPFDAPLAFFIEEQYSQLKILPENPEYCVLNSDIPFPIGMGFVQDDPALAQFLEGVVASMQPEIDAAILEYSHPDFVTIEEEEGE
jgi:polar amino acid transport system substrate-binding protein